jgi:hypothetical protein
VVSYTTVEQVVHRILAGGGGLSWSAVLREVRLSRRYAGWLGLSESDSGRVRLE